MQSVLTFLTKLKTSIKLFSVVIFNFILIRPFQPTHNSFILYYILYRIILFLWVLAHVRIQGYEIANQLVKTFCDFILPLSCV